MGGWIVVVVLINEEYGYRDWVWHTEMTASELEVFWKGIPTMLPYFFSVEALPGRVEAFEGEESHPDFDARDVWYAHIHMDDDSVLRTPKDRAIHHAGASVGP